MESKSIVINEQSMPVREYKGQRVVTLRDVSMVHQVPEENIKRNFSRHSKHFVKGVDYFLLKGHEAKDKLSLGSQVTNINVFTESGYLMLVKSLKDDLSWSIQRVLVQSYFRVKAFDLILPYLPAELKKIIKYAEMGLNGVEISKLIGGNKRTVQDKIKKLKKTGWNPKREVING